MKGLTNEQMSLYVLPAKLLFSKFSSIIFFSVLHIPFQHKKWSVIKIKKKNAVLSTFVHLTQIKKTKSIKKEKATTKRENINNYFTYVLRLNSDEDGVAELAVRKNIYKQAKNRK